jgi:predicted dehydrogenase
MTQHGRSTHPPVRVAFVGVGHFGSQHVRVAKELPGICCVGVYDRHDGRAQEVAREFDLPAFPSLDAVVEAAQAVVVATPTASHAEITEYLLDRGRDVLVEKPITATVAEAERLVEKARSGGRILAVGHIERHNPAVEAALGLVGVAQFVEVHRLGVFTRRSLDVDVVLDLMIHDLQIVRGLVGRAPIEIRAVGMPVLTPTIDIANARIAFEGGCIANLTASRVSAEKVRKCRIFGPSHYVSIDMKAQSLQAFRLSREKGHPEILPVQVPVRREEPLARELTDFARAVAERTSPLVPGEVGRDALVLAREILAAIDRHREAARSDGPPL